MPFEDEPARTLGQPFGLLCITFGLQCEGYISPMAVDDFSIRIFRDFRSESNPFLVRCEVIGLMIALLPILPVDSCRFR